MTTPEERAVIEAAEPVVRGPRETLTPEQIMTGDYVTVPRPEFKALALAVDALTASQPVSPETLQPGDKFTWSDGSGDYTAFLGRKMMYCELSGCFPPQEFEPGDLVIPIQDGEEKAEMAATSSNCPACNHIVVHDVGLPTVNCPRCKAEFIPHA